MGRERATVDFSLTNCGPLDRALARAGLKGALPPRAYLHAAIPGLACWLPLLVLALAQPPAGGVAVTFFDDLSTHARFLLVVPLLLMVEASIGRRTRMVAAQFAESNIVTPADRPRFDGILRRACRAFDSALAEAVVAALAAFFVFSAMRGLATDGVTFWFEEPTASGARLTGAGWWYAVASWLPPFLLLRWIWRYLVWCWLLHRISRLDLQITATHPDRAAGLSFVSFGHAAFSQLGFAVSCLVASAIGTKVLHEGVALASYQWPLAVYVALSIAIGLAPLAVFWGPMMRAKESGTLAYGTFASRYVQAFHRRWIGSNSGGAPLEASGDVQGLADVGASFERVHAMRLVPITLKSAIAFALAALSPMLPLLLTIMPLQDLVRILMQAMI